MPSKRSDMADRRQSTFSLPEWFHCAPEDGVTFAAGESESSPGTYSAVVYTGQVMSPGNFGSVVVDLSKTRIAGEQMPTLFHHDSEKIVGHGRMTIADGQLVHAEGILSGVGQAADEVRGLARNGFPMKASIGMSIDGRRYIGKGKSTRVNARDVKGPVHVVWGEIKEFSFVPIAADKDTSTQIAAAGLTITQENCSMEFLAWVEALGLVVDDLSEDQRAKLQVKYDAEQKAASESETNTDLEAGEEIDDDAIDTLRASYSVERKRLVKITSLCLGHPDLEVKAIDEGWDETRTELEVMRASRPKGPAIYSNGEPASKDVIEAALLLNCAGFQDSDLQNAKVARFNEKTINEAVSSKWRTFSLHGLMHEVCRAAGKHLRAGRIDDEQIRTTFEADRYLKASSGFSTVSLTGILSAVANKSAVRAFLAVQPVIQRIAAVRSLNDFKPHVSYRMTGIGRFTKVGPDGEIKSMELEETSYSNQADTYARMITLNRQMIINDDLGMFATLNSHLGRKAAVTLQREGHAVFMNNSTFFTTARGNYFEGAATNLQISSLTTAEKLFNEQIDEDGDFIGAMASTLLVPTAISTLADQLMTETRVVTGSDVITPASNPHAAKWTVIASPWLSVKGAITGNSDVAWYLLADAADIATLEVGYVQGRQQPVIESADTDFSTLGVQTRGYFDFGFALQEYRAGVKSKGAA